MSLEKDPVRLSPAFPPPVSLSEQLDKPRPPIHPKNGHQPLLPPPPPPAANQRIGKRRFSVGVGFKGVAKRRRRANSDSQAEPVLPSHFLLGGNIFDPLNLNSLLDEEVNRWGRGSGAVSGGSGRAGGDGEPGSSQSPGRERECPQGSNSESLLA
ncbi:7SK snRNA methylphosphate capping enzyme-like [Poecilia reticulata]|uniref:7SK snRNA methylphosphate capping enzyme-like n=1 Tax=Poecilia reticulata TaxID=8081 RepID=UPI0007EB53C4|nr:PREDICTED: 7SK snRNA methylphosphate capping enzyme-like [Poecilia reticulata]